MVALALRSVRVTLVLGVILCGVYPAATTLLAKLVFPTQASGGLVRGHDGKIVGAKLIGQAFSGARYFHGRPSAAGEKGYDAASSSGSNLGPTSQKLADGLKANTEAILKENPGIKFGDIPVDMVTASASGLDPHISPESALAQASRVAAARRVPVEEIRGVITKGIERPQWGIFGEPVVNVLLVNLELDRLFPVH